MTARTVSRLVALLAAIAVLPVLAGCHIPTGIPVNRLDYSKGKCPDSIMWFEDGVAVQETGATELDVSTYHGPVAHPHLLDGITASCVLEVTEGHLDYLYFIGGDKALVANIVARLKKEGFAEAGRNTPDGGYWVLAEFEVAAIVHSPDGKDTYVPGGEDAPPFPGVGSSEQWVAIAFL
jgi:hypothetical protein